MKTARPFVVVMVGVLGAAAIACSGGGGSSKADDNAAAPSKNKKGSGSNADDPNATSPEPSDNSAPSSNPTSPAGPDGGAHPDGGDAGGPTPKPGAPVCKAIATCSQTSALAAVQGDGPGSQTSASGAGSQWFTIRVREDEVASAPLSVDVLLTPPTDSSYELHVYQSDCTTELADPVTLDDGTIDVYSTWPDTDLVDDGKNLVIEVRYKSGACDAATKWNVTVTGGL